MTIIVPFAPGGSADIVAAHLRAEAVGTTGQAVVVENRAGAGTVIGASAAARAAPDGYTLFMGGSSVARRSTPPCTRSCRTIRSRTSCRSRTSAGIPFVLVVQPSLPVHSVADLIKLAKDKPGKLSFGTGGPGFARSPLRRICSRA